MQHRVHTQIPPIWDSMYTAHYGTNESIEKISKFIDTPSFFLVAGLLGF